MRLIHASGRVAAQGVENLFDRLERMVAYGPLFCDITWGAGGSTADVTLNIAKKMQNQVGFSHVLPPRPPHSCCSPQPCPPFAETRRPLAYLQICVETMMHLTCTNMPVESLESALKEVRTRTAARAASVKTTRRFTQPSAPADSKRGPCQRFPAYPEARRGCRCVFGSDTMSA